MARMAEADQLTAQVLGQQRQRDSQQQEQWQQKWEHPKPSKPEAPSFPSQELPSQLTQTTASQMAPPTDVCIGEAGDTGSHVAQAETIATSGVEANPRPCLEPIPIPGPARTPTLTTLTLTLIITLTSTLPLSPIPYPQPLILRSSNRTGTIVVSSSNSIINITSKNSIRLHSNKSKGRVCDPNIAPTLTP